MQRIEKLQHQLDDERAQHDSVLSCRINNWREKENNYIKQQLKYQNEIQEQSDEINSLRRDLDKKDNFVAEMKGDLEAKIEQIEDLEGGLEQAQIQMQQVFEAAKEEEERY